MNLWSRLFACLTLSGLALTAVVSAQDKDKKTTDTEEKKEPKTDKKDSKSDDKEPVEEKVVHGAIVAGKIKRFSSEGSKDIVLEVYSPDPMKIYNFKKWQSDQIRGIANERNPLERQRRQIRFQQEMAKKNANPLETQSVKDFEVRAVDGVKVRSNYPPIEYDDKGNLKAWTAKEKAALKGKSKLPGYPSEYETLRPGHFVQVYMAKIEAPKAGGLLKKKLDDIELGAAKPEVVMIVITGEPVSR